MDWNEDLDVGVESMNDEHKIILSLMNNLFEIYSRDPRCEEFEKVFLELNEYTHKHFSDEESLMHEMGYSGLYTHKILHEKILEMFSKHIEYYNIEGRVQGSFFDFLKFWLQSHMSSIDSDFVNEFEKKKVCSRSQKAS
jgi:hemerythrin